MADRSTSLPASTPFARADFAPARRPLSQASTLLPLCYTSAEFYALEVERIFLKEWLCVGRQEQVAQPGDYFTLDLFGEPLMVVRDRDGQIRVLSRVCRHRAALLAEGAGNRSSFQCPYHRWTYSLSGELMGAPEMQHSEGFDRASCRLPALRSEVWEGFIFANFDPQAQPLAPSLAPLQQELARYRLGKLKAIAPRVFDVPWNWKLTVENFIEPYHHIGTHADTVEPWFPARQSRTDDSVGGPYTVVRHFPHKGTTPPPIIMPRLAEPLPMEPEVFSLGGVIYPTHMFAIGTDCLLYYQVVPDSVERFTMRIFLCFPEETLADPQYAGAIDDRWQEILSIQDQDMDICRSVNKGLRGRLARPGRLSHLEKSIWQFNQFLLDRVLGSECPQ